MMSQADFPESIRHKHLHHELIAELSWLKMGHARRTAEVSVDGLRFLGEWLVEHEFAEDRRLAEQLLLRGMG